MHLSPTGYPGSFLRLETPVREQQKSGAGGLEPEKERGVRFSRPRSSRHVSNIT
jgi:hypothetical protein